MALNTTIGSPLAESHVSVADANTYVVKWYGALAAWDNLTDTEKERALRVATRFVDSYKFMGHRANEDQARAWPRVIPGRIDGQWIEADEIPQAVKSATVEAVVKYAQGEKLFPDHDGGTVKSESSSVGPLSTSKTYQGTKKPQKVFEAVKRLLDPLIVSGNTISRGIG